MAATNNIADVFDHYASDGGSNGASPHWKLEDGTVIKLYQETTGIAAAPFTANTSGISDDSATFGGYTIGQVVGALRTFGILA